MWLRQLIYRLIKLFSISFYVRGIGSQCRRREIISCRIFHLLGFKFSVSSFERQDVREDVQFSGSLADYSSVLAWVTDKCVPLVREITFENAEVGLSR